MPRDPGVYLLDILEAITRVQGYVEGMDRPSFEADQRTVDAVLRNLEIVGEAAKRVPEEIRARSQKTEWRKIAGMRDMLAQAYFEVDLEIVWDVIANKLPGFREDVEKLAEDLDL